VAHQHGRMLDTFAREAFDERKCGIAISRHVMPLQTRIGVL
jgi:hypothetical protein